MLALDKLFRVWDASAVENALLDGGSRVAREVDFEVNIVEGVIL